ncbi:MAG: outer membrane lipoprotein-sorting protein, partial [Thermoanaerobaculia bacterium]
MFKSLVFALAAAAMPSQVEIQKWLAEVDATRNAFPEAVIRARATQVLDGREQGSAEFEIYVKGRDRALIVFRDPKNNGRKVLTVRERMWLIVPGTTNPVPITPNQRLLGGASFGDVAKVRFAEDFTAAAREGAETVARRQCRVLDLAATDPRAPYPKVVLWVDPVDHLARKVLFVLPSGKEAKEAFFTKFSKA